MQTALAFKRDGTAYQEKNAYGQWVQANLRTIPEARVIPDDRLLVEMMQQRDQQTGQCRDYCAHYRLLHC